MCTAVWGCNFTNPQENFYKKHRCNWNLHSVTLEISLLLLKVLILPTEFHCLNIACKYQNQYNHMYLQWNPCIVCKICQAVIVKCQSQYNFHYKAVWVRKGPVTHRGNNSANGSWSHVLSFGLAHQSHTQVLHIEHHPLQQSLLGVRPVLWELWLDKKTGHRTSPKGSHVANCFSCFLNTCG